MKKIVGIIILPIIMIVSTILILILVNQNRDKRVEIMTDYLNHNASISFGKFDNIELERSVDIHCNIYNLKTQENYDLIKNKLSDKAYYISKNNDNYMSFFESGFYYGCVLYSIEDKGTLKYELMIFPMCSRMDGVYPFFLGQENGLFTADKWTVEDGRQIVRNTYDSLQNLSGGLCQYNFFDINTKDNFLSFFKVMSSIYCKIEDDSIIYLKSTSNVNYGLDYSIRIELFDDRFEVTKI